MPEQLECVRTTLFIAARLRRQGAAGGGVVDAAAAARPPPLPDELWVLILGWLRRNELGKG